MSDRNYCTATVHKQLYLEISIVMISPELWSSRTLYTAIETGQAGQNPLMPNSHIGRDITNRTVLHIKKRFVTGHLTAEIVQIQKLYKTSMGQMYS